MDFKFQKNILKILATMIAASLTLFSLAGCREEEKADGSNTDYCATESDPGAEKSDVEIAAVLAPTSNFVDFDSIITAAQGRVKLELGGELPDQEISKAIGRELSITVADGTPKLAVLNSVNPEGQDVSDIETEIDSTYDSFGTVASCSAGDLKRKYDQIETIPESDLLAGLAIAADQFTNDKSKKLVFVLGNGYQTTGEIRMQEKGSFPKTEKYAEQLAKGLKDKGALPNLRGATVIWSGIGQADGKELKLDQKSRDSLIYFWQLVISESNGILTSDDTFSQVGTGTPHKNSIKVTSTSPQSCPLIVKLYESDGVQFHADKATFLDPAIAKEKAKSVAQDFKKAGCEELTVHGYAAAGKDKADYERAKTSIDARNKTLTLNRAKAFASLLKTAGFQGNINFVGEGTCGTEWKANGKVSPDLQKLCRRVEVTN